MVVPDLLSHGVRWYPDRPCVKEGARSLTYAEADLRAAKLAEAFAAAGLQEGDRVTVLANTVMEYVEIQTAVQRAGLMLVPLNIRLTVREISGILSDCEPRLLICGEGYADTAEQLDVSMKWHLGPKGVGEPYDEKLAAAEGNAPRRLLEGATPCEILYTSGTTGKAKGVVMTNEIVYAALNQFTQADEIRPGDVFLFTLPLFHVSAMVALAFVYMGGTLVLPPSLDPETLIELIDEHDVTHTVIVPTVIGRITEYLERNPRELGTLRHVTYGASAIAPDVLRRALTAMGCEFRQGYGLTEAVNATMLAPEDHDPDNRPDLLASAGKETFSYSLRIVDEDGDDVAPGEVGEFAISGPTVMKEYWNDPENTAKVYGDGWLRTGDLGYRSDEGYLFITDRSKDVIVTGAENVYSREVEDAIYEHEAVAEAAVVGIPSEAWGESVHAVVSLHPGAELEPDELIAFCRERLAGYKTPKSVEISDVELPKNAANKILKREIRDRYWTEAERAIG